MEQRLDVAFPIAVVRLEEALGGGPAGLGDEVERFEEVGLVLLLPVEHRAPLEPLAGERGAQPRLVDFGRGMGRFAGLGLALEQDPRDNLLGGQSAIVQQFLGRAVLDELVRQREHSDRGLNTVHGEQLEHGTSDAPVQHVLLDRENVIDARTGGPPPHRDSISEQVETWSREVKDPVTAAGLAEVYRVGAEQLTKGTVNETQSLKLVSLLTDRVLSFQNAADAFQDEIANQKITVNMRFSDEIAAIEIDFSDNGMGIAPEYLDRIFDPFFSTKEVGEGTGLGLSIVYGIIHNHGGTITCSSKLDEGTTYSITLPSQGEQNV